MLDLFNSSDSTYRGKLRTPEAGLVMWDGHSRSRSRRELEKHVVKNSCLQDFPYTFILNRSQNQPSSMWTVAFSVLFAMFLCFCYIRHDCMMCCVEIIGAIRCIAPDVLH